MPDIPTLIGDYHTVESFTNAGFRQIGRIAVLDTLDHEEANRFLETTAFNRGFYIQFFYASEQEAVNWLLTKSGLKK